MTGAAAGVTSALRLEATEVRLAQESIRSWIAARPEAGGAVEEIAGGVALFGGVGSPLSQALHIGMKGAVSEGEFERLEEFFRSRYAPVTISLCPLAHPTVVEEMARRGGYRISHFENTLARTLLVDSSWNENGLAASARRAAKDEASLWAGTVMKGFSEGVEPPAEVLEMFAMYFDSPAGAAWLAEIGDEVVGGAGMGIHDGAAMLYGDATLPGYRGRGAQRSLIEARLRSAIEQGCDLAMACTLPGSISQRNYERFGFRVAYTKVLMIKEWSP